MSAASPRFRRVLLVGTTGMLAEAARWLAERAEHTVLVARTAHRSPLATLPHVVPVSADWQDAAAFVHAVRAAGGLTQTTLAVLWMHQTGEAAREAILAALADAPCLVVCVHGSTAFPTLQSRAPARRGRSRVVRVALGAVPTATGPRWLTWPEISAGVLAAVKDGENRVVGVGVTHGGPADT